MEPSREGPPRGGSGAEGEAQSFGPSALLTPANLVTFARVAAIPLLFYLMLQKTGAAKWSAFGLWVALGLSDLLDGWIARRQGATTSGAYLDPLADKLAVLGALGLLIWYGKAPWSAWLIIALREVAVSAFRSYAASKGVSVPATPFGKVKTFAQNFAVGVLLFPPLETMLWAGQIFLWIAVGFTVASGLDYLKRGREYLTGAKVDELPESPVKAPPPDAGSIDDALLRGESPDRVSRRLRRKADSTEAPRLRVADDDQDQS